MKNSVGSYDYLLIIGAMKCGTSSLYKYLEGHPQICPAIDKEPEFFTENQRHGKKVVRYDELWPNFDNKLHTYKMEASTGYTKYPADKGVAEKIRNSNIAAKFIYLVRNPYDRITSHMNFLNYGGLENENIESSQLLNTTRYYLQLSQYRKFFPKDDILLLDFDNLTESPNAILKEIYIFLGLDEYYPENYEIVNATKPESVVEKKIRKSKLKLILQYLPIDLKNKIKLTIRKIVPPKKRMLSANEKDIIKRQLTDDMLKFKAEYGFDTSKWGF